MINQLPRVDQVSADPFLYQCYLDDAQGFLNVKTRTNRAYESKRRIEFAAERLLRFLPKTPVKIGDVACGLGNFGLLLADLGHQVYFIDNQERFLNYIKLKTDPKPNVHYVSADLSHCSSEGDFFALFLGEAIEHMHDPLGALKALGQMLSPGGLLCLTTPNGDYLDCYEPSWSEVKDQPERNLKLANSPGSHVCEFKPQELVALCKEAGFNILEHQFILSKRASRAHILRRLLPLTLFKSLDHYWSKKTLSSRSLAKTQVLIVKKV